MCNESICTFAELAPLYFGIGGFFFTFGVMAVMFWKRELTEPEEIVLAIVVCIVVGLFTAGLILVYMFAFPIFIGIILVGICSLILYLISQWRAR